MRGFVILSLVLAAANYLVEPLGGNEEESKFLGFSNMPFCLGNLLSPRKKHRVDGGSGGGTALVTRCLPPCFPLMQAHSCLVRQWSMRRISRRFWPKRRALWSISAHPSPK